MKCLSSNAYSQTTLPTMLFILFFWLLLLGPWFSFLLFFFFRSSKLALIYSFIWQIFIEHLLCAGHCHDVPYFLRQTWRISQLKVITASLSLFCTLPIPYFLQLILHETHWPSCSCCSLFLEHSSSNIHRACSQVSFQILLKYHFIREAIPPCLIYAITHIFPSCTCTFWSLSFS